MIWLLKIEMYWKYCGREKKFLLRRDLFLSSFPQYFVTCYYISILKQGPDFHFEINGYSWKAVEITITKTYLYNFDPLKPLFYIVKLGFTWVYIIFLISAEIHRLWVLVRTVLTSTHSLCFKQKSGKYQNFYLNIKFFIFRSRNFQYILIGVFS